MIKTIKSLSYLHSGLKSVKGLHNNKWRRYSQVSALIIIVFVALSVRLAESATYKLPDCSQATVQSYVDKASDYDILACPAGSWTWTTITQNTPAVTITKAITLMGAGGTWNDTTKTFTSAPTTTIIDATNSEYVPSGNLYAGNEVALRVSLVIGKNTRISGFSFSNSAGDSKGMVSVYGTSFQKGFRIDHCYVNSIGGHVGGFIAFYSVYGVVDHCEFHNPYPGNTIMVHGNNTYHYADTSTSSFMQPNPAGTDNAVYVEDSTFFSPGPGYGAGDFDCDDGGNMVIRYNQFYDAGIQEHDTAYIGGRGCRHVEIYNNTWTGTQGIAWVAAIRSGSGVIHDNVINGNYGHAFMITNYRSWITTEGISTSGWGWCDGTRYCDGNDPAYPPASDSSVPSGYPCIDSIGRITDTYMNGPTCYGNASSPGPTQPLEPLYAWNNKFESSSYNNSIYINGGCKINANGVNICITDHIKSGRDYYDNVAPKPGYTPFRYPHPLANPSVPKLGAQ